jgi:hypothetical protein
VFSKNFCEYRFVSLAITSAISAVQNNSEYPKGLLGSSKSTFLPGLPVNGKRGHSEPDFAHMQCYMLLLSLTFSSSELTLCCPHDEIMPYGRAIAQALVAGFPPWWPECEPGSGHVGFVMGQVFSEYFSFPCHYLFHQLLHSHLSSSADTIGQ